MDGKPEYVTLAILKELLDDLKQEIGNFRKDVEDVKISLQLSQG